MYLLKVASIFIEPFKKRNHLLIKPLDKFNHNQEQGKFYLERLIIMLLLIV